MSKFIIFLFLFCVVNSPAKFAVSVKEKTDLLTEFFNREETIKFAGYGEDKLSTVLVTGALLCHPPYQLPVPISGIFIFFGFRFRLYVVFTLVLCRRKHDCKPSMIVPSGSFIIIMHLNLLLAWLICNNFC